jgi:hypothetical protein
MVNRVAHILHACAHAWAQLRALEGRARVGRPSTWHFSPCHHSQTKGVCTAAHDACDLRAVLWVQI